MVDLKANVSLESLKSLGRKSDAPTTLPKKDSVNLAQGVSGNENRRLMLVAFGAAVIVILVLAKLFVVDVLATTLQYTGQVHALESQLQSLQAENRSFDRVSEEYSRYVVTDLTDEEALLADRGEVTSLVRGYLLGVGDLLSLQVSGNQITANVAGVTMAEVSAQVNRIQNHPLVSHVTVSTAQGHASSSSRETVSTVVITLAGAQVPPDEGDGSRANTVYEALTGDDLDD